MDKDQRKEEGDRKRSIRGIDIIDEKRKRERKKKERKRIG